MKTYQLTDTSHQIITYKCIVKANSKEEAIKKARIGKIAAEGMAAASKELAEEAQNTERVEVKEE